MTTMTTKQKKYKYVINQAILTALVEYCEGSQTKLAEKLGMDRSYITKSLNELVFPTFLLGKFKKVFPKIPLIQYTQVVTVRSDVKIFCKKLIADFMLKGKQTPRLRESYRIGND